MDQGWCAARGLPAVGRTPAQQATLVLQRARHVCCACQSALTFGAIWRFIQHSTAPVQVSVSAGRNAGMGADAGGDARLLPIADAAC